MPKPFQAAAAAAFAILLGNAAAGAMPAPAPAGPVASGCIADRISAPLRGTVRIHHFEHPNGTRLTAYHLVLPEARCFSAESPDGKGRDQADLREIMLVQTRQQGIALAPFVGKEVLVTGDVVEGITAWYSTNPAIDLTSIVSVAP